MSAPTRVESDAQVSAAIMTIITQFMVVVCVLWRTGEMAGGALLLYPNQTKVDRLGHRKFFI